MELLYTEDCLSVMVRKLSFSVAVDGEIRKA